MTPVRPITPGPRMGGPMGMGMGGAVERPQEFGSVIRRMTARLRVERWPIALVVALGTASVFLSVLGPKLLGDATNIVFAGVLSRQIPIGVSQAEAEAALREQGTVQASRQADMLSAMTLTPGSGVDFTALARLLALVIVVYVASSALLWAQGYIMAGVTQRTVFRLREDVEAKIMRLPLSAFDGKLRGDLLSRVTNDIDNVSMTLQQSLTQLVTAGLTVIGVLAMMIWISPLLAVISLLTIPASLVITLLIARRSRPYFAQQWRWTGLLNGHIEEMYTGHEIVRVFGYRQRAIATFDEANDHLHAASFRAQYISGIIQPAINIISNLNYVLIAVIGGLRVATGMMSLGDVQAFIQYSRQFTMPITQLAGLVNLVQSGAASAERVFTVLDEPDESADPPAEGSAAPTRGRISFESVSFRYDPDVPLIEDLTVHVEPGQVVAIVGPTGAGKTTLVNLLMRFYDVNEGRITLDGVDIRDRPRGDLRRNFGMVLQDAWLFTGTIRDNIAYGRPASSFAEVQAAARATFVDHFVQTLPLGYDTILEDDATNISAGERQLLTIARAFLLDPPVLILDEATSSVDTRTEVLVQRAMAQLRQGRTAFVIAHRLSTIRKADVILVLDRGRIVEQGTHEILLRERGAYYDLFMSQFAESLS